MDKKRRASCDQHLVVAGDAVDAAERLCAAFSGTCAIGFAVLDEQLRYQAINNCLATINGIQPEAHLGFTTREIFGEISKRTAEPSYHLVLAHGATSQFELKNAVLPARAGSRYWGLNINFPIRDRADKVRHIGILVVEVTVRENWRSIFPSLLPDRVADSGLNSFRMHVSCENPSNSITQR